MGRLASAKALKKEASGSETGKTEALKNEGGGVTARRRGSVYFGLPRGWSGSGRGEEQEQEQDQEQDGEWEGRTPTAFPK